MGLINNVVIAIIVLIAFSTLLIVASDFQIDVDSDSSKKALNQTEEAIKVILEGEEKIQKIKDLKDIKSPLSK